MGKDKDTKKQQKPEQEERTFSFFNPFRLLKPDHECIKTWDDRHHIYYCCICGKRM